MLVLGVESATDTAGVALADDAGVLASASATRGRRHGESIAPAIEFVCARAGVVPAQLDAVAVDVGPGLFTGLRVGVATAKGLGFALGIPVVEMTSLELLALDMARWCIDDGDPPGTVLVPVVDARRGQLFAARFTLGDEAVPEQSGEDRLVDPEELVAEVAGIVGGARRVLCAGDGARRHGERLQDAGARLLEGVVAPDPAILAVVGLARARSGAGRDAAKVTARYLRPPDVRIKWETRFGPRPVAP
jgi:tRNA threonylcarbamoyladenosine biosynthesis protein TsaB